MKYMVLMYADPAATEAMSASGRADVARMHEALHQDLAGSACPACLTGRVPGQAVRGVVSAADDPGT